MSQTTNIEGLQTILETVNNLPEASDRVELPELSNEGSASDMLAGKQLINSNREVVTGTIPSLEAQTIIPNTTDQTIAAGKYLAGAQTIKGDANLVADNIKSGVSIFGVAGSHEGSGGTSVSHTAKDITLRVQSSPMATTKYASKVVCTSANSSSLLRVNTITNFSYMNYLGGVPNTLIFIKTANNPTDCIVSGDLELIEFVSSSHAIIRVAEDGEISGSSSGEIDFPDAEIRTRTITIG